MTPEWFHWRTRIGNFKFAECTSLASATPNPSATATTTPHANSSQTTGKWAYYMLDSPDPVEVDQELTYNISVHEQCWLCGVS